VFLQFHGQLRPLQLVFNKAVFSVDHLIKAGIDDKAVFSVDHLIKAGIDVKKDDHPVTPHLTIFKVGFKNSRYVFFAKFRLISKFHFYMITK